MLYVPEALAALVRQKVAVGESVQQLLSEISTDLELLARRELD